VSQELPLCLIRWRAHPCANLIDQLPTEAPWSCVCTDPIIADCFHGLEPVKMSASLVLSQADHQATMQSLR
jgi:hypothetical protein